MNNKYKILLIEDEPNIRTMVGAMLAGSNYKVVEADSYADGLTMYRSYLPDLVILDLGLPDRDGMDLLGEIRRDAGTPVIVLSARTGEADKVAALDLGANDYVTKPFGSAELLARVRCALRIGRTGEGGGLGGKFVLRDLTIDYDARRVTLGGEEIKLTQTEYNIVALLSQNSGKMMTYAAIIKAIWGYSSEGSIKKLQVNMANIRKKLKAVPGEVSYIANELGVGYRMDSKT